MLIRVFHQRREGHQELAVPRTTQLPPPQRGAPQYARALRKPQLLQRRDENSRRGQDQEKSKTLTGYQYIYASVHLPVCFKVYDLLKEVTSIAKKLKYEESIDRI